MNENNVMSYGKQMLSNLRRYKDKENSDKT